MRCTKPRQPALNENFNLPYGSHVKKHDTRLVIGRIAFLTRGKSDTRHLIGLHRFANENLLCSFWVCKYQLYIIKYDILWSSSKQNVFTYNLISGVGTKVTSYSFVGWSHYRKFMIDASFISKRVLSSLLRNSNYINDVKRVKIRGKRPA